MEWFEQMEAAASVLREALTRALAYVPEDLPENSPLTFPGTEDDLERALKLLDPARGVLSFDRRAVAEATSVAGYLTKDEWWEAVEYEDRELTDLIAALQAARDAGRSVLRRYHRDAAEREAIRKSSAVADSQLFRRRMERAAEEARSKEVPPATRVLRALGAWQGNLLAKPVKRSRAEIAERTGMNGDELDRALETLVLEGRITAEEEGKYRRVSIQESVRKSRNRS